MTRWRDALEIQPVVDAIVILGIEKGWIGSSET